MSLKMSEYWSWFVHAVLLFFFNGIVKQKQTILIGLCQQHDSDLSPTHVHILLQRQEGSIHQWSMLSKHTKGFISNLRVCVCVCACQTTPALLLFSVAHPSFFFAEFLWAIVFWSAISFHQHEMDSQISLVIFNKKPWDAQQKSAPHDTCGFSQRVHGGARQQPPFAGYTRECEDMNQFETDLSCSKTSNLGRLLQPYNNI